MTNRNEWIKNANLPLPIKDKIVWKDIPCNVIVWKDIPCNVIVWKDIPCNVIVWKDIL